jgi:hypothetical protein
MIPRNLNLGMKFLIALRILGTAFEVLGYFIQLNFNSTLGVVVLSLGQLLMMPFMIKTKAYDVVALLALMFVISASSLIFNYSIF